MTCQAHPAQALSRASELDRGSSSRPRWPWLPLSNPRQGGQMAARTGLRQEPRTQSEALSMLVCKRKHNVQAPTHVQTPEGLMLPGTAPNILPRAWGWLWGRAESGLRVLRKIQPRGSLEMPEPPCSKRPPWHPGLGAPLSWPSQVPRASRAKQRCFCHTCKASEWGKSPSPPSVPCPPQYPPPGPQGDTVPC